MLRVNFFFFFAFWHAHFDPYIEEIKWLDLWVRIPRFPTKLLNYEYVVNMLAYNNVGTLVKLDVRSLSRHEISFTRVCVRVDIIEPLLKYAKITRARGVTCGYVLWYEDFSTSCSFCGCDNYSIEKCVLLYPA